MTPERWKRLADLFEAAVDRPRGEREAFLAAACADDPELRGEVEAMVASHEEAGSFGESPAFRFIDLGVQGTLAPGSRLGRYEIVGFLSAGGMGEVYRSHDPQLRRTVAIKILPRRGEISSDQLKRFEREARAVGALNHPNILTVYDVGVEAGIPYVVSELLDGETLHARLAAGAVSVTDAIDIALQMASGLEAAHDKGLVHRDIKPQNVFITNDGRVKILDFGLARQTRVLPADGSHGLTERGLVMGTAGYMSPEQVRGQQADARSDVFAFGAVLYEMLTGLRAFTGDSAVETMNAILTTQPKPLPNVPASLDLVVQRCLEKDPQRRWPSMREASAALEAIRRTGQSAPTMFVVGPMSRRLAIGGAGLAALALCAWLAGATTWLAPARPGAVAALDSLVVLPLDNLSGDADQDYFADGLTEAVITELSRIRALRVISRTSAMRYRKSTRSIREIARDLRVKAVLTGSVVHAGDRVRVSAQLIDPAQDRHIWADSYERDAQDVLRLQRELAGAIVAQIRVALTPEEQARLRRADPVNVEAHEAYLKGRFHWNRRTEEGIHRGMEFFARALALDPGYAAAHAGLAQCYVIESDYGSSTPRESFPKAKAAARRALELDPDSSEAHAALALSTLNLDLDWLTAEAEFKRAIELDPNDATAHHWYALLLGAQGRWDEATRMHTRAQQLDPLSLIITAELGWLYHVQGLDAAAQAQYRKAFEIDEDYWFALMLAGRLDEQQGRPSPARARLEKAVAASGRHPQALAAIGRLDGLTGNRAAARRILGELDTLSKRRFVSGYQRAAVHASLGDSDTALRLLREFHEQRGGFWLIWLRYDPWFRPLHERAEFKALIRAMNLPPV